MLLSELLKKIEYIECLGFEECEIVGVTERSGNVSEGFVFVAVEGNFENGERYIEAAYERGAFATVVSSPKRKTYYKFERSCKRSLNSYRLRRSIWRKTYRTLNKIAGVKFPCTTLVERRINYEQTNDS